MPWFSSFSVWKVWAEVDPSWFHIQNIRHTPSICSCPSNILSDTASCIIRAGGMLVVSHFLFESVAWDAIPWCKFIERTQKYITASKSGKYRWALKWKCHWEPENNEELRHCLPRASFPLLRFSPDVKLCSHLLVYLQFSHWPPCSSRIYTSPIQGNLSVPIPHCWTVAGELEGWLQEVQSFEMQGKFPPISGGCRLDRDFVKFISWPTTNVQGSDTFVCSVAWWLMTTFKKIKLSPFYKINTHRIGDSVL